MFTDSRKVDFFLISLGLIGGFFLGAYTTILSLPLSTPTQVFIAASGFTAIAGTYLALVGLLLASRLGWLEKSVGHDRMLSWHAKVGKYAVFFILLHAFFTTLGHSEGMNIVGQFFDFAISYPWMLSAIVSLVFLLVAAASSAYIARSRLSYERWWSIHLFFYLAIALSFFHQIFASPVFTEHPFYKNAWILLYVVVYGTLAYGRIIKPFINSRRADFHVVKVEDHGNGMVSVYTKARKPIEYSSGQFFNWRFSPDWWSAHPYSISGTIDDSNIFRITVKGLGDHSKALSKLKKGSRVSVEGPYGVFTLDKRKTNNIVAIAAGVGITPIRALADDLDEDTRMKVLYRVNTEDELLFVDEFLERGVAVHALVGPPNEYSFDARTLLHVFPEIKHSDVYVCGPPVVRNQVLDSLEELKVPNDRIHYEDFSWAVA